MELPHFSHCLPWLLAVSYYPSSSMELLHVSHCFPWLLAVFYFLCRPIKWLHVSHCLSLWRAVSQGHFRCHGVAAYLSLSPIFACSLSLSLPVPWCCCISLIVFHICWQSPTVSLVPWSCYMSHNFSHCCWLSLTVSFNGYMSLNGSHVFRLSLTVSPTSLE